MRLRTLLIVGVALGVTGCGEGDPAQPAAVDEAPAAAPDSAITVNEIWDDEAFVAHMHEHAEKLDELNFELADGNLAAAKEHADWLATHDTNADMQADWMPLLYAMRSEAEAVVAATNIDDAQAAAQRITIRCQECHAQAGVRGGM